MLLLFIIVLLISIFRPSIDIQENQIILWYGKSWNRKFIILWEKRY